MDVRMPDGTIITNVPEGITQSELTRRLDLSRGGTQPVAKEQPRQEPNLLTQIMDAGLPGQGGSYLADLAFGVRQTLDAGAQMLARGTGMGVADTEAVNKSQRDLYNKAFAPGSRAGSDVVRGVGQGAVLGPLAPAAKGASMLGTIGRGAGMGAVSGALTPVYDATSDEDFWGKKRDQAQTGAIGGGGTSAVLGAAGRVLAPKVAPAVQQMLADKVTPTPGQVLGGAWKAAEEKARSIPILGDAITSAQRRGIEQFNQAVFRRALEPIGKAKLADKLPPGNEGIAVVQRELSSAYEDALARSAPSVFDRGAQGALLKIEQMVPRDKRGDFIDIITAHVRSKVTPAGTIAPSVMKEADSALGAEASSYMGSSVASERKLGQALAQAQRELRTLMRRYNKATEPELRRIDKGYANLTQIENAGSMLGAKDGIFTPAQFLNAVKKSDKSVRDRKFAAGDARNQGFAQSADAVLSQKYPDSGTAGRAMIGGAAAALGAGALSPAIPAAVGLGALAYTPTLQRALVASMTKRYPWMQGAGSLGQQLAPYLGAPAAGGLLSL